jgi:hypothetical protein
MRSLLRRAYQCSFPALILMNEYAQRHLRVVRDLGIGLFPQYADQWSNWSTNPRRQIQG